MKIDTQAFVDAALSGLQAIAPGMLGAAVGQLWKPGLTWPQRIGQWVAGVCFQYYVSRAIEHGLGWNPFVSQAIGFFVAVCAFEVAPRLVKAIGDACANLPDIIKQGALDLISRFKLPGGPS